MVILWLYWGGCIYFGDIDRIGKIREGDGKSKEEGNILEDIKIYLRRDYFGEIRKRKCLLLGFGEGSGKKG